jgi:hypothetical protein
LRSIIFQWIQLPARAEPASAGKEWYMNMRLLAGLLFAVSVVGFSLGASLPLVSLRLHEAGAGTLEIGIISAIPAAGMMLSAFHGRCLLQAPDQRTIYLLSFSLCTLSIALLEWAFDSMLWLALRLGLGIGMGIAIILGESWVNELCPDHNRGKIMALYATSFTGFQVLGRRCWRCSAPTARGSPTSSPPAMAWPCCASCSPCPTTMSSTRKAKELRPGRLLPASPRRCAWRCCSSRSSMPWCCRCCRCMPPAMVLPWAWRH